MMTVALATFLTTTVHAQISVTALEGNYRAEFDSSYPGWAAFDAADIKPGEYTSTGSPNGQSFSDTRDNVLTYQFGSSLDLGEMLLGIYDNPAAVVEGTLKVFEVDNVSGDLTDGTPGNEDVIEGSPIFSETFSIPATSFTTSVDGDPVGTLNLDFSSTLSVEDRTFVSSSAGYAFQFDITSGTFNVSNRSGINPTEAASYYRLQGGDNYTAPFGSNEYQVGFAVIPEPSSYALMLVGVGLFVFVGRRRRA